MATKPLTPSRLDLKQNAFRVFSFILRERSALKVAVILTGKDKPSFLVNAPQKLDVFGGAYFYGRKGTKQKVYSAEFKICVIMGITPFGISRNGKL